MPSYEFRCPICNVSETKVMSIHDVHESRCANCNVDMLKVFFAPPVSFSGSGWAHKE